jgi:hypothetical protein
MRRLLVLEGQLPEVCEVRLLAPDLNDRSRLLGQGVERQLLGNASHWPVAGLTVSNPRRQAHDELLGEQVVALPACHLPSNLLLGAVAFAPNFGVAATLLLGRAALSQMDIPTRQAYVISLVTPADGPRRPPTTHRSPGQS